MPRSAECTAALGWRRGGHRRRWQCVHRAGDRKQDWTKPAPGGGFLWALHCGQTPLAATGPGGAGRLAAARGRRRWPRRWSCSPSGGSQTQVDRPGDSGNCGSAPGGRRCGCHDESRMAGYAQAPTGRSIGCMLPAWQWGTGATSGQSAPRSGTGSQRSPGRSALPVQGAACRATAGTRPASALGRGRRGTRSMTSWSYDALSDAR